MANVNPVFHKVLTLSGAAQQLAAALDLPGVRVRSISLQAGAANANPVFLGGPEVSATVYGVRLPTPVTNIPAAPYMLEDADESTTLENWYVIGTSTEKLHVLVVAYV